MIRLAAPLLLTLLSTPAHASDDAVIQALQQQIDRNAMQLTLTDAPPIYHLRYHLEDLETRRATASHGALLHAYASPRHQVSVEVRVGTPAFDSMNFEGFNEGYRQENLYGLSPRLLHEVAWRATDGAYKDAVEQYAQKRASFVPEPDSPGDYVMRVGETGAGARLTAAPQDQIQRLAVELSGAIPAEIVPAWDRVFAVQEVGAHWVLDSEGAKVMRPHAELIVAAGLHLIADDGLRLTDQRTWIASSTEQLPSLDRMRDEISAMAVDLAATARAPAFEGEYVGPVLFEGQAAATLFRHLLIPQLEGTPQPGKADQNGGSHRVLSFLGMGARSAGGDVRVGRRVLPEGWEVRDDPRADLSLPFGFAWDQEGTPSAAVDLVTDGIVRSLLMGRIPRRGLTASNGHARGIVGERLEGRATTLEVTAPRVLSERTLHRRALSAARSYGLDYVLVVRRLQEPTVQSADGERFSGLNEDRGTENLPAPVAVYRLYADGREERLRGARFASAERWVLREIVAAGQQVNQVDYLAPFANSFANDMVSGLPTRVRAPSVLIGELELVPQSGDPQDLPIVPAPKLASGL